MSSCPLCGSSELRVGYRHATDYLTGVPFDVTVCGACGVGITQLNGADLGRHYPRQYRRYQPWILALLRWLYRLRVDRWTRGTAQPGLAFEVGCADGFMLDALRRRGWRVIGSERTAQMLRIASQAGIPVFAGDPEALASRPMFDLIILFQVLEHLPHPEHTLAELSKRLKPGGQLVIGVPNRASWQSALGGQRWFHLDVPRHLFHFTPRSLTIGLNRVGLTVRHIGYASFEHDPFGWIQTLLNRVDTRFNRLTRLLMRIDRPDAMNLLHLVLAGILALPAVVLALLSWAAGRGAIMEIVAEKVGAE